MTHQEMVEHKVKCHKVMMDHLKELGYPDMTNEEIANEFKDMWRKLEEAGLIIEGMNYQSYIQHANFAFLKAEMEDAMGI